MIDIWGALEKEASPAPAYYTVTETHAFLAMPTPLQAEAAMQAHPEGTLRADIDAVVELQRYLLRSVAGLRRASASQSVRLLCLPQFHGPP